jgi:hypothetical protein
MARRPTTAAGEAAHQRLKGQMEDVVGALSDRLDEKFGRLDDRLARMENDIGKGALDRGALRSDINETRRDVGELRDAMALQTKSVKPGTRAAISEAAKSPLGRLVGVCIAIAALAGGIDSTPKVIRFVEGAWHYASGRQAVAAPAAAPVPKK